MRSMERECPDMDEAAPFQRAFTVGEANALVPALEGVFGDLDEHQRALAAHLDRIQILDVLWGRDLSKPGNPDRKEFLAERTAVRDTLHRIDALVSARLMPLGVRVPPGGLEHGLVDFPSTLDGRWVFLCWKRGENRIRSWHELDGGFAGRQPLTPGVSARMGGPVPADGEFADLDPGDDESGDGERGEGGNGTTRGTA
ncbi:MAG: DUF2203 family protein [Gemmatimonadales bacterium]|nr:MAG: DUF2203 family protein [Gemmatimonadales bacterium]